MTMEKPALSEASGTDTREMHAKRVLSSWEHRASLLSQYGLPNMENLWLVLVKTALCKWEGLRLPLEAVASQIGQSVAVAGRVTNILADANLISVRKAPTTGTELEITVIGEQLVVHGLQFEQSPDEKVEPIAIPLSR